MWATSTTFKAGGADIIHDTLRRPNARTNSMLHSTAQRQHVQLLKCGIVCACDAKKRLIQGVTAQLLRKLGFCVGVSLALPTA